MPICNAALGLQESGYLYRGRRISLALIGPSQIGKTFITNKIMAGGVLAAQQLPAKQLRDEEGQLDLSQLDCVQDLPEEYKQR